MPVLFIFFGLRFMFFSNDHEPIHVHVVKGKGAVKENAKFSILPEIRLIENNGLQANETGRGNYRRECRNHRREME